MPLLQRRSRAGQRPLATPAQNRRGQTRALTGSAAPVRLSDHSEAKRLTQIRQGWQLEALTYGRSLGELRYAKTYLGNSASRMRLHVGVLMPGDAEPTELTFDNPADLGIPDDLAAAALAALARLGSGGPLALAALLRKMTENFEVPGECFLLGRANPDTGVEEWTIRSISEVRVQAGQTVIYETPNGRIGSGAFVLDPNESDLIRLWWPDSEYSGLADSPIRSCLDICEELMLVGRDVRATARSRLANNGFLFVPDTLSVVQSNSQPGSEIDPNQDPFMAELMATMTTALTDEGSAAAVAPILLRGPEAAGNAIKHILIQRPQNVQNIAQRQELITRLATAIDLPAEILTGKADISHWGLWLIDDDSFRHHIEPIVVAECDALTVGFLWPQLFELNQTYPPQWDPALINKLLVWYDPTPLLTHPDQSADAVNALDRGAIGREAFRRLTAIPDNDKPDELDEVLYILSKARGVPPPLLETILKKVTTTIQIPDLTDAPGTPEIGEVNVPPAQAPAEGPPPGGPPTDGAPPDATPAETSASLRREKLAQRRALVASAVSLDTLLEQVVP